MEMLGREILLGFAIWILVTSWIYVFAIVMRIRDNASAFSVLVFELVYQILTFLIQVLIFEMVVFFFARLCSRFTETRSADVGGSDRVVDVIIRTRLESNDI